MGKPSLALEVPFLLQDGLCWPWNPSILNVVLCTYVCTRVNQGAPRFLASVLYLRGGRPGMLLCLACDHAGRWLGCLVSAGTRHR